MKPRLVLLALCVAGLGVPLAAGPQNPPPPPTPPPPATQTGGSRGGIMGGVATSVNQPGRSSIPPAPLITTSLIVGRVIDPATGKGVSGTVVTLQGGPTRMAQPVQPGTPMTPQGPPPPPPQILTDAEGRFAFMSLTRGNYTLTATKAGYTAGGYGRLRPDGPTRPIQLDDGEKMADATIRIFKFASISGTVIDEAGEPVVSTPIRVYRRVLMSGRRVLSPNGPTAQTDDRGMYRIPNLTPGDYVVVAPMVPVTVPASSQAGGNRPNLQATSQALSGGSPIPGGGGQVLGADNRFLLQRSNGMSGDIAAAVDASGRITGFSTVYYPNAPTASGAQVIPVASGEERNGVDLAMRRVPTVTVSGLIVGPDGPAGDYAIRLVPTDTGEIVQEPETAVAMSDASGSFLFLAVPSGQYVLQAVRIPRPTPMVIDGPRPVQISAQIGNTGQALTVAMAQLGSTMEPLLWAMAPVSVSDTDVHGMSLTLREGLTISGRLEFSGTRPRPDPQRLTQVPIAVERAEAGSQISNVDQPSRVQADGRFVTTGQLPGKYFIRVGGAPAGWMVQSITANGVDATDAPLDLSASVGNVVVTFTDLVQDLRGTVSGLTPTSESPAVIVFPSDSTAWKNFGVNPTRMKMTRSPLTGQFAFGFLPAGDYFAVAIPDEYRGEWQDPAYLEILSRTAVRFSLSPGERKTIDLTVQDVKPPSIGRRPAPQAVPYSDNVFADDRREHGPFVATPSAEPAPQQVRDTRTVQPVGAGSISGVVRLDDGSSAPARFARVSVRSSTTPGERIALTDNEGRYSVPGLPAGSYQVSVTKPAYLSMYYGARRPVVAQGLPVRVEAGQAVTGIDVMLKRGGVVTGVVIGADGEPAPNVRVQLLQRVITDGEPRLTGAPSSGQSMTDDHGMFRLFGLRPGSYALSATPVNFASASSEVRQLSDQEMRAALAAASSAKQPSMATNRILAPAVAGPLPSVSPAGRPVGFAPVYYPGTTVEEEAGIFSVAAGQEVRTSISLQLVPTARVEGTVVTADGQPVPMAGAQVMLQRSNGFSTSSTSIRMVEAGRFQAIGVAPGRYQLVARWTPQVSREGGPGGPSPVNSQWFAQQDVDVAGVDVAGISLTLAPPLSFSGKVVFDGPPPAGDAQVQVRLDGAGRTPSGSFARTLKPTDNGEFTITGVPPGRYRLNAFVNVPNPAGAPVAPSVWAVRSALIDGRDALESPFELQAGRAAPSGVITLTTRLPQLSATITDQAGKAVPNMVFVLFSASREHWTGNTARRVRSQTRPNDDGVFQFNAMLPGDYYLAVLTDLEPADLYDPSFLEQLVPAAIRITLAEGDKKTQNLRIAGR